MARSRNPNLQPTSQERLADSLKALGQRQGFLLLQYSPSRRSPPFRPSDGPRATFDQFDEIIKRAIVRQRGQRGKLAGAILVELLAIEKVRERKEQYRQAGRETYDAWEEAIEDVARLFGCGPGTLKDWMRGKSRREREKPIEERSFRHGERRRQGGRLLAP